MKAVDDLGRCVALARRPEKIVSLVPSITETLWAFGAGPRIAGVTRYCIDPPEARRAPRVGGTKNPDCDAILALEPDLVLMSEEENRLEDFRRLEGSGVAVFVSMPRRVEDVVGWALRLGELVECADAARRLDVEIREAADEVRAGVVAAGPPALVFCPIWKKPWMTFNADTYASSVLDVCGGRNVFADAAIRYPKVELEEARRRRPELVLLPDEPYPFGARDLADVAPLLAPGGPARRAGIVDGQALSWYGARTPRGLRVMREAILGGNG